MQTQDDRIPFPEEATERGRVVLALASPYVFAKWCRTRVGRAPNCFTKSPDMCVLEEYLYDVAGARTSVQRRDVCVLGEHGGYVITPTWSQRVVDYVDWQGSGATYNDVANMVMTALQKREIA